MKKLIQRLKDCGQSNAGFTMAELVVSLLVFSIFSVALMQFMSTAATIGTKVNNTVTLSTQSQVALGLIEEYLVECSGMAYFDDTNDRLYIVNNQDYSNSLGDRECIVHVFDYVEADEALYYYYEEGTRTPFYGYVEDNGSGGVSYGTDSTHSDYALLYYELAVDFSLAADPEMVSKNIDGFHVSFETETERVSIVHEIERTTTADITFEMSNTRNTETYEGTTVMYLRNKPMENKLTITDTVAGTTTTTTTTLGSLGIGLYVPPTVSTSEDSTSEDSTT